MHNLHEHSQSQGQSHLLGWFQSRKVTLILLGFLSVGAFFLLTEHTAHVLGMLPYLIFLLCPLMMLFMHAGHGNHGEHGEQGRSDQPHDEPPSRGRL